MNLSYGIENNILYGRFYLADRNWKDLFPNKTSYEFEQSDSTVTQRTKSNPYVKAEIVHKVFTNGVRMDITAEILPNSGSQFAVWDIYLAKSVFAFAKVRSHGAPGQTSRRLGLVGNLDPKDWKTIAVDTLSLTTTNGEWTFTLGSDTPVKWELRSLCNNPTLGEAKRTFSLLNNFTKVPPGGMKEKLWFEARFTPKPGVATNNEDPFSEKVCAYLRTLLARYGSPTVDAKGPKTLTPLRVDPPPSVQAQRLGSKVCAVSANLEASRLDPRAGIVIPEPKSYKRMQGFFVVPTALGVACSTNHEAALELLTGDLALHGVKVSKAEPSGKTSFVMGVPTKDPAIADGCRRFGILVNEKTPGPEGYVLVVTPREVLIAGSDDAGVLYAAQTLRQLIRAGRNGAEIPAVMITDRPDMKFRGFYVEGGGKNANTDDLRRLIRNTYSYFKANTIVLEMRWDDFRWRSHPEVSSKKALSLEDLSATAAYARRFHIEVIPAVFTYGKTQALLRSHPEIAEDPSWQEKHGDSAYCPNKTGTYTLIFDMMKEIIAATQCRRMHIGHDEIAGMALCPLCQKIPPADLFANDVNNIATWLAGQNVETMIWGDMLLESARWKALGHYAANSGESVYGGHIIHPGLAKIRKDVVITDWHYGTDKTYPTIKHFADNGFRVIGCPWYGSKNNYYLAQQVKSAGQMGVLVTDWGFLNVRAPGASSIVGVICAWNGVTPEPSSLPWSPDAVLAASILDKAKPSRMRGTTFIPIPIDLVGNRLLSGDAPAWFSKGARHDLSCLPAGPQRLFSIDYQIGKKCVVVDEKESTLRVPVNAKAKSFVFLHALSLQDFAVGQKTYGQYRITYASGEKAEAAINSRNAAYWLSDAPRENPWGRWAFAYTWDSMLAWEGCTKAAEAVNLQAYEWVNPRPDDPVATIEVAASQKIPGIQIGLVALTAVQ